jgi:hypothetical protein
MLRILPFLIGIAAVMLITGHLELIIKVVQEAGQVLWPYLSSFLQSIGGRLQ